MNGSEIKGFDIAFLS